jgi:hypothetical protein
MDHVIRHWGYFIYPNARGSVNLVGFHNFDKFEQCHRVLPTRRGNKKVEDYDQFVKYVSRTRDSAGSHEMSSSPARFKEVALEGKNRPLSQSPCWFLK